MRLSAKYSFALRVLPACGALFLAAAPLRAAEPADTTALHEVEVVGHAPGGLRLTSGGRVNVGADALRRSVRTLGDADYIAILKGTGGVTSLGSDYGSGVSIDGSHPGQTAYTLNGAPIFFPYHLGGIFSTFAPQAIGSATLTRTIASAALPDAGAANLDFRSPGDIPRVVGGELNIGMLAPSLALRIPVAGKLCVRASARYCLLNELYPWLLKSLKQDTRYNFHDVNIDVLFAPDSRNRLAASFFTNADKVNMATEGSRTVLRWGNLAASLSWQRQGSRLEQLHSLHLSRSHSSLAMDMSPLAINAPSHILQVGAVGSLSLTELNLQLGYTLLYTRARVQNPEVSGLAGVNIYSPAVFQSALRGGIWGEYEYVVGPVSVRPGVRLSLYGDADGYRTFLPDPMLTVDLRLSRHTLTLHGSRRHQFTHEVGFTDIGLASNFRLLPGAEFRPLETLNAAMGWHYALPVGLSLSAEVFYKHVNNEAAYFATIIDALTPHFDCRNYVEAGRGFNLGGNITAQLTRGPLSASLAYSLSHSRRRYPSQGSKWFTAPWSIPHSLTASGSYSFNRHWDVMASMTFASGRPVSPIRAIYVIAGALVADYGERYSSRLPAYRRIDLGASYRFESRHGLSHAINLSLANIAGFNNIEMRNFAFNMEQGTYYLRNVNSIVRFLPSISYTLSFQ